MKNLISFCLALAMAASLADCSQGGSESSSQAAGESSSSAVEESSATGGSSTTEASETPAETPETVTITSLNAEGAETQLEVPYDPQRIAILDMASLDILDALGVGGRVVGTASTSLDYLQSYINEDIANLGTIKEADLEAVMSCEPDVIFIGGRLASSYDALSEIAPVVYLSTDTEQGVVESVRKNANIIASLFGLEEEVDSLMADFDSRIAALAEFAEGKTAIVGLVTSGGFNVLGNDGRCSMICREVGFENIGVDAEIDTATHGNEASFEFVVEKDPDYIFVLDRDAAIQTEGAQLAQEIVENELVKGTRAYTDGHIVYLSTDTELGVVESVGKNANTIASLFGLEEEVDSLMADFDSRVAALAEFAEGKTAIVGLVTSGGFNVLGNDGRCSMICREAGFENIGVDAEIDTATHGNEASFEFVVEKDPDYIFVLDRDAAIQTEGAQLAQEIVENELVKGTRAYADGHIVYLSSPAVWYTAEGGITALDVMLRDLESELLSQ